MPYQFIQYEKKDRIAYVTINRPEVMNSLHPPSHRELTQIWQDFLDDPDCWVAILTGAGEKAFSAGNDLRYTAEHPEEFGPGGSAMKVPGGFGGMTSRFDFWKPLIAAVNGYALGGGLELALACDIIVAAEHAQLGLPEPRVGLMAGAGGVFRLPRQIPLKIAMGMIVTGKPISAAYAHQVGLVNEVVPGKELMTAAQRWAGQILECAPLSVRASKQAAMMGLELDLETAMNRNFPLVSVMQGSEDWVEGPRAFTEKRKPQWKGR